LKEGLNRSEDAVRASEERLRLILDTAHEAFVSMDVDSIINDWNRAAEATFGWQAEEVIGRKLSLVLIPERYRFAYEGAFRRYLETGQARMLNRRFEIAALHRYGHEIPVELSISALGGGAERSFNIFLRDVSARREAERAQRALTDAQERALESMAQLAAIVEGSDDAIYSRDRDGRITSWNRAAELLFGYHAEEVLGRTAEFAAPPGRKDQVEELFTRVLAGQRVERLETERLRKDGSLLPVALTISPTLGKDGTVTGVSTIARDMSAQKRYEDELRRLANTDPLTGLTNRRRFFEELDQLLRYLHRYGRPGAVLMIDLDNLKEVNDTFGHEAGDAFITRVANTLASHARGSDLLARLGGDEFIMAVPEVDADGARLTAERLATALTSDLTDVAGNAMSTSASIGVASFVGIEDVTADELVRRADEALYEAKRARRRRVDHYKPAESGKPPTANTRRSRWAGR
jgi:diguanylate cyclase (GGDEF)-like protein/PAS domain S-box-containing protein